MIEEKDLYFELERFKREPEYKNELSFYNTLKKIELYIPVMHAEGKTTVATLKKDGKEEFYPAFTSLEEFKKWPFELKEIRKLYFNDLTLIMMEDVRDIEGVVINPFGKAILLGNQHIERMETVTSGMSLKRTGGINDGIYLYTPKTVPNGLKSGLELFFQSKKDVQAVHLYQARRNEKDPLHWMFVVKFNGTKIELFPKLAAVIQLYMDDKEVFELVKQADELKLPAAVVPCVLYERKE